MEKERRRNHCFRFLPQNTVVKMADDVVTNYPVVPSFILSLFLLVTVQNFCGPSVLLATNVIQLCRGASGSEPERPFSFPEKVNGVEAAKILTLLRRRPSREVGADCSAAAAYDAINLPLLARPYSTEVLISLCMPIRTIDICTHVLFVSTQQISAVPRPGSKRYTGVCPYLGDTQKIVFYDDGYDYRSSVN